MSNVLQLLQRQVRWQKSRQALPWPEKIRLAQQMRDAIQTLRAHRPAPSGKTPIGPQTDSKKDT